LLFNLSRNSSRPLIRIRTEIGVNNPKKIIPRTIGLTIIPRRTPNFIHSLFNGKRTLGLTIVMHKNTAEAKAIEFANEIEASA
jgi:hypothetical protein